MEEKEKKVEETKVEVKDEKITKTDGEKTAEELKAEAEALESQIKELKEKGESNEYKNNQLIRVQKAREKLQSLSDTPKEDKTSSESDTRDLITLSKLDIPEDSEKAKILAKYKASGLIKSYAEGLDSVAIKAEFDAIDAKNNAKTVIDENDTDDVKIKTTKEIINSYRVKGEVPKDAKLQKAIAEDNLKQMGI